MLRIDIYYFNHIGLCNNSNIITSLKKKQKQKTLITIMVALRVLILKKKKNDLKNIRWLHELHTKEVILTITAIAT